MKEHYPMKSHIETTRSWVVPTKDLEKLKSDEDLKRVDTLNKILRKDSEEV